MWEAIILALGIVSTFIAYYFNPSHRRNVELDKLFNELDILYEQRDKALERNDSDTLTRVVYRINVLRSRKNSLLQR